MDTDQILADSIGALWRYPVKSMQGEELEAVGITQRGLAGDRAYALVDASDGKVATAKNPRKWPELFGFRACFPAVPDAGAGLPAVRITLPDGTIVSSDADGSDLIISQALSREVTLEAASNQGPTGRAATSEGYWPDIEGIANPDAVTEFELREGTFFDSGIIHLLTMATLRAASGALSAGPL